MDKNSVRNKAHGNDGGVRLRVVVIVKHRGRRHRVHAVTQAELEFEVKSACLGPHIKDNAVSATQCRPPEFGRRAAISLAECSAEMAVTGKAQVMAYIRQVVIVAEKVQRPCKPQAQLIAV